MVAITTHAIIRERIVEVLAKYNRTLEDAPLGALALAMERMIDTRGNPLLKPVSKVSVPDITTPEGAKQSRAAADYYRDVLKPFA